MKRYYFSLILTIMFTKSFGQTQIQSMVVQDTVHVYKLYYCCPVKKSRQ